MDVIKKANLNLIRYDEAMAQKHKEVNDQDNQQDEQQNNAIQALLMRSMRTRLS